MPIALPPLAPPNRTLETLIWPEIETYTVAKQVPVWMLPDPTTELVKLRMQVDIGRVDSPQRCPAAADVMSGMLTEGADDLPGPEFQETLERFGISLGFHVDELTLRVSLSCLATHLDHALSLMWKALIKPRFDRDEFEQFRARLVARTQERRSSIGLIAKEAATRAVLGDSPFAKQTALASEVEAAGQIDVQEFHAALLSTQRMAIGVWGHVDPARLVDQLDEALQHLPPSRPERRVSVPEPVTGPRRILVHHRDHSKQASLGFIRPTVGMAHPDADAMNLANLVVGGSFNARLSTILREEKSYTYGAYSRLSYLEGLGLWSARFTTQHRYLPDALRDFIAILDQNAQPLDADESLQAQFYQRASLRMSFEQPMNVIHMVMLAHRHGLDVDWALSMDERYGRVTPSQVAEALQTQLNASQGFIVAVGDGDRLAAAAEGLGPVERVALVGASESEL